MRKSLIIIILSLFCNSLFGDDNHNIQNFYGERATGMGGAFTGISDDTSGAFYNPAGLSFILENHYSINVSSYKTSEREFKDLFGPGQNYTRSSRTYLPNFIGFTRRLGKWNIGLTMINPINESFDQTNRITLPIYRRNLSQLDINYNRERFQLLTGPSVSYQLSEKLSIGLTTYYMYDTNKVTSSQNENQFNNNVTVVQDLERRRTSGILPIVGIQYMPLEKLSLGASLKKTYVTGGTISSTTNVTSAGLTGGPSSVISQGSDQLVAQSTGGLPTISGGLLENVPEVYEIRSGFAFFPTKSITISTDFIYTSGYNIYYNQSTLNLQNNLVTYKDPYLHNYERNQTLNFAGGIEFYLTDNIVIRLGRYTNKSNNRDLSWWDGAIISQINNTLGPNNNPSLSNNLQLEVPTYREVHTDLQGYTFGIGFETAGTTLNFAVAHQYGRGVGFIDKYQLPTTAVIKDTTFFISGGSKY
ncbi:MAG: hypothetical protein KDK36_01695 [Leptospiraceae bacterium]|nr:hypothetical protein [Leptospiraceae bacterium]